MRGSEPTCQPRREPSAGRAFATMRMPALSLDLGSGGFGVRRDFTPRRRFAACSRQGQGEREYRETDQFPGPRESLGSSRWMYGTPASVSW